MSNEAFSSPPSRDMSFELAKLFMPYGFGALWWGRDDLIQKVQKGFVHRPGRIGHPLLSVMKDEVESRYAAVPMLFGTSGTHLRDCIKKRCISVCGLTEEDPRKISYFGSIPEPGLYGFEDLMDGIVKKAHSFRRPAKQGKNAPIVASEAIPWYELRTTHPNTYKSHVNSEERRELEEFCKDHNL